MQIVVAGRWDGEVKSSQLNSTQLNSTQVRARPRVFPAGARREVAVRGMCDAPGGSGAFHRCARGGEGSEEGGGLEGGGEGGGGTGGGFGGGADGGWQTCKSS